MELKTVPENETNLPKETTIFRISYDKIVHIIFTTYITTKF